MGHSDAGTLLAGFSAAALGYGWAFVINSLSLSSPPGPSGTFGRRGKAASGERAAAGLAPALVHGAPARLQEYREGLAYMRSVPLMIGSPSSRGLGHGRGAAQILFALFGEQVFHRGASGIGAIWGFAGIGLLAGGFAGHVIRAARRLCRDKRAVTISYILHGVAYMVFSQCRLLPPR